MGTIVVGVDGSPGSKHALRWAVAEAKQRGAVLRVVHSWAFPYVIAQPGVKPVLSGDLIENEAQSAGDTITEALDELGDATAGVEIKPQVVEGAPAQALLDAAQGADLLVVGSRGHGGFAGLLLGSVSQQCAHHTPCPLVIVPEPSS